MCHIAWVFPRSQVLPAVRGKFGRAAGDLTSTWNIGIWGTWGKGKEGMQCSGLQVQLLLSLGMACPVARCHSLIGRISSLLCWLHWKPTAGANLLVKALAPAMLWLFNLHGLHASKTLGTAGRCTQPGQQAPDSMRQRISPLLSWASLTSPCFAVSNDQQKGDRPQLWTRTFSSCTRIARANCLGRKLFLKFILYFKISGLFVSEEYLLLF